MKVKVDIKQHIQELAEALPYFKFVRMDTTLISGASLRLSALKHDKNGKPWDPKKIYEIECPVLQKITLDDHQRKMTSAFLSHGLQGLYGYLSEYLTPPQVKQIKDYFMRAQQ
jgi:hypothetical protein